MIAAFRLFIALSSFCFSFCTYGLCVHRKSVLGSEILSTMLQQKKKQYYFVRTFSCCRLRSCTLFRQCFDNAHHIVIKWIFIFSLSASDIRYLCCYFVCAIDSIFFSFDSALCKSWTGWLADYVDDAFEKSRHSRPMKRKNNNANSTRNAKIESNNSNKWSENWNYSLAAERAQPQVRGKYNVIMLYTSRTVHFGSNRNGTQPNQCVRTSTMCAKF